MPKVRCRIVLGQLVQARQQSRQPFVRAIANHDVLEGWVVLRFHRWDTPA
jgi:hypothetical protein